MSHSPFLPTPSDTQPRSTDHPATYSAMVAAGRKRLTHDQVAQIREAYTWARSAAWAAETAEEWENVAATEERLGREYGLSATSVHNLVLGLTYPDAPGPIDTTRRAAYEQYQADMKKFGANVARSRARDIDPAKPQLRLEIHQPGGEVVSQVLSPGSVVRVAYVPENADQG